MDYVILAILFLFSGFFMKYSDDLFDENHNLLWASILGVLCAIASAIASIGDVDAAYIFISILIGNFFAFKIDGVHHVITLVVFVCICLIAGIPQLNLAILLVCILGMLSDEIGHELIPKFTQNIFLNFFFEYRFVMKIVVLLFAVLGIFNLWTFVFFIFFDLAYVVAGVIFERLN